MVTFSTGLFVINKFSSLSSHYKYIMNEMTNNLTFYNNTKKLV